MLEIAIQRFTADVLLNIIDSNQQKAVVDIMENLFFLVVAAILLAVSVSF